MEGEPRNSGVTQGNMRRKALQAIVLAGVAVSPLIETYGNPAASGRLAGTQRNLLCLQQEPTHMSALSDANSVQRSRVVTVILRLTS